MTRRTPGACNDAHGMKAAKSRTESRIMEVIQAQVAGSMASIQYWDQKPQIRSARGVLLLCATVWVLTEALITIAYQAQAISWSDPDDIHATFRVFNIITLIVAILGILVNVLIFVNDRPYSSMFYISQCAPYAALVWAFIPQVALTGSNYSGDSVVHMTDALSAYVYTVPIYVLIAAFATANLRRPTLEGPSMDYIARTVKERVRRPVQ